MAQYKDIVPSQSGWIHELARGEVNPELEAVAGRAGPMDPQQLVEESAIEFLTDLREQLTQHSRSFNSYSEQSTRFQEVKIYTLANSAADFMLFRNQVRLIFANTAHGVIQISFSQHQRNTGAPELSAAAGMAGTQSTMAELLAQVSPFRDVYWTYQGEKVTVDQVAKFYFTEFCRSTRDQKKSRVGNQVLLDQIKALLQEKGLDL
jgi:hypothetical protein